MIKLCNNGCSSHFVTQFWFMTWMQDNLIFLKKPEKCKKMYVQYTSGLTFRRELLCDKAMLAFKGRFPRILSKGSVRISLISIKILKTLFPLGAKFHLEKCLWLLSLASGKPSPSGESAAWTVAGALVQEPLTVSTDSVHHAPSALGFSLRDLIRPDPHISCWGLSAPKDSYGTVHCAYWRPPLRQTQRAKPDRAEQNPELFFTQKNETLFCISGMNKWDFNEQVMMTFGFSFPLSNSWKTPWVLFVFF